MSPSGAPQAFNIMAKPTGSAPNLNCVYCFFLKKEKLYPESSFRMSDEVHEGSGIVLLGAIDVLSETARVEIGHDTPWEGIDTLKRMRKKA